MKPLASARWLLLAASTVLFVGGALAQGGKPPGKPAPAGEFPPRDEGGGGGGIGADDRRSNLRGELPEIYSEKAVTFSLGEFFRLGPAPEVGVIKDVHVSRPKLVQVLPRERNASVAELRATGLGVLQVTLVGTTGKVFAYTIRIAPNIEYIRELVRKQFPLANVQLTPAGDNIILVDGTVDAPGEVQPIIEFVRGFVDGRVGTVINGIKVGGVMQVQLQVCIAKVDRAALRSLRASFLRSEVSGFQGLPQPGGLLTVPSVNARGGLAGVAGNASNVFPHLANATTSSPVAPFDAGATAIFGVTQVSSAFFGAIEALRQDGLAKILATPTLVTLNGRPADFLVGGEQPVPQVTGAGGTVLPSVEYRAFGTRLTFVPIVLGEGKIRLNVIPEVSRLGQSVLIAGTEVPRFETQRLNATVEVESGQTVALGGLLQTEETATVRKVPVLGDIPWFGALFRRVTYEKREQELLVLVTPLLAAPLRGCQVPAAMPGQESRAPNDAELFLKGRIEIPVGHPDGPLPHGIAGPHTAADLPQVSLPPPPAVPVPTLPAPVVPAAGRR